MYQQHFGLKRAPFTITPDPDFVFLSTVHREALAHLLYGAAQQGSGGFTLLTGEVGSGKTTLCRLLMTQLPEGTRGALILNPTLAPVEILASLCDELEIDYDGEETDNKRLLDRLNAALLDAHARGERVVVVLDEAQNLSLAALEQVRLLTNLETAHQKLLQIILLGQPELRDRVKRPELRQLDQRITARYHLNGLDTSETADYLLHRLRIAGRSAQLFTPGALKQIYRLSDGLPRLINTIADRALLCAYANEKPQVTRRDVRQAASEVRDNRGDRTFLPMAALTTALIATLVWMQWGQQSEVVELELPPESPPVLPAGIEASFGFSAALSLLGVPTSDVESSALACRHKLPGAWHCLERSGNRAYLRTHKAPMVLEIEDRFVAIAPISDIALDYATTVTAHTLQIDNIEPTWQGRFFVLWQDSAGFPKTMRLGDTDPSVPALRAALTETAGLVPDEMHFGATLERAVMAFQEESGLEPDGVFGPETQYALFISRNP